MPIEKNRESMIPADIFKMYDIRGIVDDSLTPELMRDIGLAFGTVMQIKDCSEVCVGSDGRLSSPALKAALIEGVLATGANVIDIGMAPSPLVYFAAHHFRTGTGLVVTASHNPGEYNGVKMLLAGHSLFGSNIQKLRQRIVSQHYLSGNGRVKEKSVRASYCDAVASDIQIARPLKVVIDCANGVGGAIAPELLRRLGCEVTGLYCDVDGRFPNHEADPTRQENLRDLIQAVRTADAELGLALDGDADRMIAVAPDGRIIWPDQLMILFARDILSRNPDSKEIVFDVKCTRALDSEIVEAGGKPIMWKTGHSLMKSKLAECGAVFGGEMSGHFFFADRWPGFDDGMYAAARLCELVAGGARPAQDIFDDLPQMVSTPEIRMNCSDPEHLVETFKTKVDFIDGRMSYLDGVRVDFDHGFGLIRASNTASEVVLRFESESSDGLLRIMQSFDAEFDALNSEIQLLQ